MRSISNQYLFVILPAALFIGCASEKKDLINAKSANTIPAYEAFLEKHPEGALADSARLYMERIYFHRADSVNTITAFEGFLEQYPQGLLSDSARVRIDNLLPPAPELTGLKIVSTESDRCEVHFTLSVRHKAGTVSETREPDVYIVMFCGHTGFFTTARVEKIDRIDANHSTIRASFYHAGPDATCSGTCSLKVSMENTDGYESNDIQTDITFR